MSIRVQGLTKIYGKQKAIDSIGFEIRTGEIVGFLGPNGAGKTTTMKILTGFMPASDGEAYLNDVPVRENSPEVRRLIGYLPEHNPLYLDMYVHEYLTFTARLYKMDKGAIKKRIPELIEMTGLQREQHKQIGMLSKGYRQRVGLAQALIHDPPILILDEPTTGLDPNQIIEIRNLIRETGKTKTIIFSTHILPEVEAIAGRVIIINLGKIVADQTMEELQTSMRESLLHVELEREGFEWSTLRSTIPSLEVREISPRIFEVRTPEKAELGTAIFHEAVRQNNPLLEMRRIQKSLEDIFRSLTRNPVA